MTVEASQPLICPECDGPAVSYVEYVAARRDIEGFNDYGVLVIQGLIDEYELEVDIVERREFWCSEGHSWLAGDLELEFI